MFTFAPMFFAATVAPRRERVITAVFFFLSGLVAATWSSRIPDVQHHLQLNDAQWGRVLFTIYAGLICGLPISSWLVSRFGSRTIMVTGGIIYSLVLGILGIADSTWQLVLALFLFGFSRNLFNISVNTSAVEVQQLYNKPIISTFHGLWSLACFVAAAIGSIMIAQDVSTCIHFFIIAVFCALMSYAFKNNQQPGLNDATENRPLFVKPDRYLLLLGAITFCSMLCEGAMSDWTVSYFERIVGADKNSITVGYTSFIVAMTIGRLTGDRVVARFGAINVIAANGLLIAAGLFIAILLPYFFTAALGFLLVGLGTSIMVPQVYSLASRSKKMKASYAIASVTFIGYIGFLIGPVMVGSISEAFGMQWSFALIAVLCMSICFLTAKVKKLGTKKD
ncbi:MFS transporter [Chitinophagaceae bacterium LB-8]|uniref:MFS transporter n=1 Tax=Paraflavisolibacter caeni TaxID=2982496 RepID=A0A9X2XXN7_9BACT|nr:MFS transporter [Paraflavisolibacter caeni]MCU7551449.1 MFS transporter [Paraflavisolibacter caeni]